jgi:hypothetical protein
MSEEDLGLLITTDDPGEDTLGEDNFHRHPTEKTGRLIHTRRLKDQRTEVTVDSESAG